MACLSSRIPYGTPVTLENLSRVGQAEQYLRSLGVRQLRVRHHVLPSGDPLARIETDEAGLGVLLQHRAEATEHLKSLGYLYVTMDLGGYRTGSLNEALKGPHEVTTFEADLHVALADLTTARADLVSAVQPLTPSDLERARRGGWPVSPRDRARHRARLHDGDGRLPRSAASRSARAARRRAQGSRSTRSSAGWRRAAHRCSPR